MNFSSACCCAMVKILMASVIELNRMVYSLDNMRESPFIRCCLKITAPNAKKMSQRVELKIIRKQFWISRAVLFLLLRKDR